MENVIAMAIAMAIEAWAGREESEAQAAVAAILVFSITLLLDVFFGTAASCGVSGDVGTPSAGTACGKEEDDELQS